MKNLPLIKRIHLAAGKGNPIAKTILGLSIEGLGKPEDIFSRYKSVQSRVKKTISDCPKIRILREVEEVLWDAEVEALRNKRR